MYLPKGDASIANNPRVCAERRLIDELLHKAYVKGIPKHKISSWISKHYGPFKIFRETKNGEDGTSLPCILCRQRLAQYNIKWIAYVNNQWIKSDDVYVPDSKFTNRQKQQLFKNCLNNK